jgi:predicted RecA/RadA family phage recombinase
MKNYVGTGEEIDFVAGANLSGGTGLLLGTIFGVVIGDVLSGSTGALFVGPGVVTLPKAATITPANGAKVYWDNTNLNVTTTASGNSLIGIAVLPVAAAADATLAVRLDGVCI